VRFTTAEVADATGGEAHGPECSVDGASIDSRTVAGGELFVPLKGQVDGHQFIEAALAAGAAAYLTEQEPRGGSAVQVASTADALTALGAAARGKARDDAVVVGITGSVGKTTTKDLVSAVLATAMATHASPRSYNNEIGVPLTLLNAPAGTQALVLEMGARARGDIETLCRIVRPTVGVVTRVAAVHTEGFGDVDGVERAKRELVEALPERGTAVLNADDPRVARMAAATSARVVTFGAAGDVRPTLLDVDGELRPLVRIATPDATFEARLAARGEHQVVNAAAAAAVGWVCGVPPVGLRRGLEEAPLSGQRMALSPGRDGLRVIDDTYNANPPSVEAALRSLVRLPARRRVAVLGPMAELGTEEIPEHARIGRLAAEMGVEVVAVGTPHYGVEPVPPDEVQARLAHLGAGDVVLVKGSRVAGLEHVADALRAAGPA
jgi:UDP-N-acetylmuramoyl-tripeptide--D-alanyl-D-alanine ligase